MMTEKWTKWEPISGLVNRYHIESISESSEGFKVLLFSANDEEQRVQVVFENSVASYRCTDESFRLNLIGDLSKQYGRDFYGEWTLFKVTNSGYLKWLSEESLSVSDRLSFMHFSFIDDNSILDVAASYEPRVEFIK